MQTQAYLSALYQSCRCFVIIDVRKNIVDPVAKQQLIANQFVVGIQYRLARGIKLHNTTICSLQDDFTVGKAN